MAESFARPIVCLCALALLLAGCGKVALYSKLEEQEGNEMLGLLLDHGIRGEKRPEKDDMVSLYVDSDQLSTAIELLKSNGFPREQFSTIKDIFTADKLITTPFEDRTRYLYGLSQEMAETLSQLDGVVTTRVHLVIPEEENSGESASASVFIKHNASHQLDSYIPQIKSIVSSAIAGVPYDAVTVALFSAEQENTVRTATPRLKSVLSIELAAESIGRFYLVLGALLAVAVLSIAANLYLVFGRRARTVEGGAA